MTRILSELLQIKDPSFRQQLHQLERVNGHNKVDIRLSVEVVQAAKQKIRELGLDQNDTTAKELYHALMQRLSDDDQRLERALRTRAATYVSAEADLMAGMLHALEIDAKAVPGTGIKPAVLKKQLKKQPPKRLQKMLGYRSVDAMLRHESPVLLVAGSLHVESAAWRRLWRENYKRLTPTDFESKTMQVISPSKDRWQSVTDKILNEQSHTVVSVPEAATVILLPLPEQHPSGMVIASLALAMHELNAVAAASNYLRASQVHGDFGQRILAVADGQVQLTAPHMPQAMPWQLIQRYFATTKAAINEDVFGPYVQAADFYWHDVEAKLAKISPSLSFWQQTAHITYLHDNQAVSFNLIDAAINRCNHIAYEAREVYHAQQSLWHELTLRYLDHSSVEAAVAGMLHPQHSLETTQD